MGITAWRRDREDATTTRVLIVDDDEDVADLCRRILTRAGYQCSVAHDAPAAEWLVAERGFDVVLTDMNMPGESGLELASFVRRESPDAAVIVVTGMDDTEVADQAIEMGAVGYLLKPFNPNALLIQVSSALRHRHLEMENARYQSELEARVRERTAGLSRVVGELLDVDRNLRTAYEEAVVLLCRAAEFRDPETGSHLQRMSLYSARLAKAAGIDRVKTEMIRLASPMHDIGKIAVPDHVLLATGSLSDEERDIMRKHPETGFDLLNKSESPLLRLGGLIALSHHERFDGSGYPYGLSGEDIPIEGRIVAIADVFDALTSARPYKEAFSVERSCSMIAADRGQHFDPELVDAFFEVRSDIEAIAAGDHDVVDVTEAAQDAAMRLEQIDQLLARQLGVGREP